MEQLVVLGNRLAPPVRLEQPPTRSALITSGHKSPQQLAGTNCFHNNHKLRLKALNMPTPKPSGHPEEPLCPVTESLKP